MMSLLVWVTHYAPGSILDSHDELQVQEMINIGRLSKRAIEKDVSSDD